MYLYIFHVSLIQISEEDINEHPFYIGQGPAYASGKRAATCVISRVCAIPRTLNSDEMYKIPTESCNNPIIESNIVELSDGNSVSSFISTSSKEDDPTSRNSFAYLTAKRSIFNARIDKIGVDHAGLSIGIVLRSSLSSDPGEVILFGQDAVSYGIYVYGSTFRIGNSSGVYICKSIVNDLRHGNYIGIELTVGTTGSQYYTFLIDTGT